MISPYTTFDNSSNFVLTHFSVLIEIPQGPDHLACYSIGKAAGEKRLQAVGAVVDLSDRFQDATATVGRAFRVCTPVDKNGEGVVNPSAFLVCYDIEEQNLRVGEDVLTTNQFDQAGGAQALKVRTLKTVCVPSEIVEP